ncbi:MAG TPA: carboxypeptidase [Xanthobacteraceae bacterium]|nr:carboxypeptidase [Xanthobacteraceae bacterium]
MSRLLICAALVTLSLAAASADEPQKRQSAETPAPSGVLSLLPPDSVTEHTTDLGDEKRAYTATAGTFPLYDQNGERSAAVFYTAYVARDARGPRPLTFVFNGGPGASSAYLHLGLAGPRVVDFGKHAGGPPQLVDNPDTWLRFTDLVFVDPVGTGWSRAAKPDGAKAFWSVQADAQVLAKVIALYVAKNARQASPLYLLGESYGGYRAVKIARAVQREQGLLVRGIVMVSPFLDGAMQAGARQNALTAALHLPSLAAAALDRKGAFTPEALAAAEKFAMTDYLVTLAGPPPEGAAARAFYARVAELTGLPEDVVARRRGFVGESYVKHAAGNDEIVSHYDATFSAADPYPESSVAEGGDPILDGFTQALGGAFVAYARETLGYRTEMTFHLLNREVSGKWDWDGGRARASAARDIRELLALDESLRILIAHGRSDLVTPYGVSRYVLDHLPPMGKSPRTALKVYKGGHMFYFDAAARRAFTADAAAFYMGRDAAATDTGRSAGAGKPSP